MARELTERQRRLVELYSREPNVTRVAEILGVHRVTVYRWLNEEGVQDAIVAARIKLDGARDQRISDAQDIALEMIEAQLKAHKERGTEGCTIQDTQRLMQVAEKLAAMKKNVAKETAQALSEARRGSEEVDWDTEPTEDE